MRQTGLKSKLIVSLLLASLVPMAGTVIYVYIESTDALREQAQAERNALAVEWRAALDQA